MGLVAFARRWAPTLQRSLAEISAPKRLIKQSISGPYVIRLELHWIEDVPLGFWKARRTAYAPACEVCWSQGMFPFKIRLGTVICAACVKLKALQAKLFVARLRGEVPMLYIGTPKVARALWKVRGIERFYSRPGGRVAAIGYSPKTKKWYGWSQRAICGFKTRKQAARFAAEMN